MPTPRRVQPRRYFLSRLTAGLGLAGVALSPGVAGAQGAAAFRATRHREDDWLDALGSQHRFVFDTTTPPAFSDALRFANNFLTANQTGYGLKDSDSGVVLVARHLSTVYGYNDAMWAKYGATLHAFSNPGAASPVPAANPFNNGNAVDVTIGALVKRGAHFAVCGMATTFISTLVAKAVNGDAATIRAELAANLVPNAHMAAAGIVAVNRAQERGYTLATA
jgi:intracellular sulfur oxidation DsrE/DsrF family protein